MLVPQHTHTQKNLIISDDYTKENHHHLFENTEKKIQSTIENLLMCVCVSVLIIPKKIFF